MSSKALALLLSLPLGLALTACGDDGGGGGDDSDTDPGTTTMDTPTTAGPTTNTPTTDEPTTDEPTTEDTIDPDTTAGETDDTMGETEDDTMVVEPMPVYYRVNSLNLRDPHVFVIGGDQTDTVNGQLTGALSEDSPDDKEGQDGVLDLGFVLGFLPLDQADAASESMFFTNAACTAPVESTTCDVLPPLMVEMSTYTSAEAGECYAPTPANLSEYAGGPAAPEPTSGPCFSADFAAVTILAGGFELPMTDVHLAASYVGNPAGNLVAGNIEGFISTADAEATIVPVPVVGDQPLADLLREEDQDGDGWIFHLAYTAVPVDWTGA